MPVSYPVSADVTADTDATAAQYNALRDDAVDARIVSLTAGENLTALDAVYVKAADGKAYKAKSSSTAAETVFFGFAVETKSAAETVQILCYGYMDGFSSLTTGSEYYLDTTYGAISATEPTTTASVRVGIAVSTTTVLVMPARQSLKYSANTLRVDGTVGIGAAPITTVALYAAPTLASAAGNYCFYSDATMVGTGTDACFAAYATVNASVTNFIDVVGLPTVASGKTVTNRYFLYPANDTGDGSVTATYFAKFDGSSPFLTGVTTHDTESDEIKVDCNGTPKYIKLYT